MKNILIILILITGFCLNSQAQRRKDRLENKADSISYAIGISFANSIQNQHIPELNIEKIALALENVLNDNEPKMTAQDAQKFLQVYLTELKEIQKRDNLIKANEFLESNKKKGNITVLPSGLQYEVINEGQGQSPVLANRVKTHYKGMLLDGTVFDSSYDRGEPIVLGVGQVIDGWKQALQLMKPGAKWKLYIHPDLGYGERATGNIPANSLLIFEIELLSIE